MTENKYSWLDEIINDLLNEVMTAYNERGSTSVTETLQFFHKAYLESRQAIIAKIEAERAEAVIEELNNAQKISLAATCPACSDTHKNIRKRIKELEESNK